MLTFLAALVVLTGLTGLIYVTHLGLEGVQKRCQAELVEVRRAIQDAADHLEEGFREGPDRTWITRVTDLEDAVDRLPSKWDEMVALARRAEERNRGIVRGALEELEEAGYEHAGVEAAAQELRLRDGDGGSSGGVSPVRREVDSVSQGAPEAAPDPERDWEAMTFAHKYSA